MPVSSPVRVLCEACIHAALCHQPMVHVLSGTGVSAPHSLPSPTCACTSMQTVLLGQSRGAGGAGGARKWTSCGLRDGSVGMLTGCQRWQSVTPLPVGHVQVT